MRRRIVSTMYNNTNNWYCYSTLINEHSPKENFFDETLLIDVGLTADCSS